MKQFIQSRPYSLLILIILLFTKFYVIGWNDASRFATIESLVEYGTFQIDKSDFVFTMDKIRIGDHFYSDKPPLPAVLGAGIYWLLHQFGLNLDTGPNPGVYLINLFLMGGAWFVALLAFQRSLILVHLSQRSSWYLTYILAVGSIALSWFGSLNNHMLAASFLSIGYYFYLKGKYGEDVASSLFLSGLFFSMAGATDVPTSLFVPGFFILLVGQKQLRKQVWIYTLAVLLITGIAVLLNRAVTGDFLPPQMHSEYFDYPGSPWQGGGMVLNGLTFSMRYLFHLLIGHHGFILYNPLLFLLMYLLIRKRELYKGFGWELSVIGCCSLVIVIFYTFFTHNYGGSNFSVRWFLPFLPLFYFFLYPLFQNTGRRLKTLLIAGVVLSIGIALIGLINPWSDQTLSSIPLTANLKQLRLLLQ